MKKKSEIQERLEHDYDDFCKEISAIRKKNYDTTIVDLKLGNLKSKIMYASASEDERDIQKVYNIINEIKEEIKLCKQKTSVRDEIEKRFDEENKNNLNDNVNDN